MAQNRINEKIAIVLVVLILAIAIYGIYGMVSKNRMISNCAGIQNAEEKYDCYYNAAGTLKEVLICDNIKNSDLMYSCYWNVARIKEDQSICDKLPSETYQNECYNDISGKAGRIDVLPEEYTLQRTNLSLT